MKVSYFQRSFNESQPAFRELSENFQQQASLLLESFQQKLACFHTTYLQLKVEMIYYQSGKFLGKVLQQRNYSPKQPIFTQL